MAGGTNPNGANQYVLDPRQKLCWDLYVNPKSETFANGLKSAIRAGYSESHANTITTETWFQDRVRRLGMLGKAEKVLEEMLDLPTETIKLEKDNEGEYDEVVRTEPALVKIKQDTAKFIASTVGKDEGYSTRSELSGPGGKDLIPDEVIREKADEAVKNYLNGITGNTLGK